MAKTSRGFKPTDLSQPPRDAAVHFVQDDDDDQIDNDGGGRDGDPDAGAARGGRADRQRRRGRDPVDDDSEHDGERQPHLRAGTARPLRKGLTINTFLGDFKMTSKTGSLGHIPESTQFCIKAPDYFDEPWEKILFYQQSDHHVKK